MGLFVAARSIETAGSIPVESNVMVWAEKRRAFGFLLRERQQRVPVAGKAGKAVGVWVPAAGKSCCGYVTFRITAIYSHEIMLLLPFRRCRFLLLLLLLLLMMLVLLLPFRWYAAKTKTM